MIVSFKNPILVAARFDQAGVSSRTTKVARWWFDATGQWLIGVPFALGPDRVMRACSEREVRDARRVLGRLADLVEAAAETQ